MIPMHHRLTVLVLSLVVSAIAVPAASAMVHNDGAYIRSADGQTQASPIVTPNPDEVGLGALAGRSTPASSPTQLHVVHVESNPGFDWGDAGIGAGAAFALTMIGLGGALVVSSRRRQGHPAATA